MRLDGLLPGGLIYSDEIMVDGEGARNEETA